MRRAQPATRLRGHVRSSRAVVLAALVMALAVPPGLASAAAAVPGADPDVSARPRTPTLPSGDVEAEQALRALLEDPADADVARDADGAVTAVTSTTGEAVVETRARTPEQAVREVLAEHGEVFGLDGVASRVTPDQVLASATGGSVVRSTQVVDGLPVFGGQVVTVLDDAADVVSMTAATSRADEVAEPRVSGGRAARTATTAVARARGADPGALEAEVRGLVAFDPAVVHVEDVRGVRPAWEVAVGDGGTVRETVLVGAERGEVALRFDVLPGARERWVCDNGGAATVASRGPSLPVCVRPSLQEGAEDPPPGPEVPEPELPEPELPEPELPEPSGEAEQVEEPPAPPSEEARAAYRHLGAADDTFTALRAPAATPLTELVGATVGGVRRLVATVDWCFSDVVCPYRNAFWDPETRQVVFGRGFAAADDVVAHELAHGFIEATSGLFYFQQSGALNESLADTLGEIVDQRHVQDGEDATREAGWPIGEDVQASGWTPRWMSDPTRTGQPDRMRSPHWAVRDWDSADAGGLHHNMGVGNKTAFLVSQGTGSGTFNGRRVVGIDQGDPMLRRTGALYLEVVQRLPSAAQYADLGRTLVSTCEEFVAQGTRVAEVAFTASHCSSVRAAVAATELEQPTADPAGVLGEAARECPTGAQERLLARDDDGVRGLGLTFTDGLWGRAGLSPGQPGYSPYLSSYARSGRESIFGYNPDPEQFGEPAVSEMVSRPTEVPRTTDGVFLHFHHAFALESLGGGRHLDGATVRLRLDDGTEVAPSAAAWTNGPRQAVVGRTGSWFAGDSKGWGSTRLDLTAWAGQRVQVVWRIHADQAGSAVGWWLDDLRLYACEGTVATAPRSLGARTAGTSATVSWHPPAAGAAPVGYVLTRSDRAEAQQLPASARSAVLTALPADRHVAVSVRARARGGAEGAASSQQLWATASTVVAPARVKPRRPFVATARVVRRGSAVGVGGVPVVLERRQGRGWVRVASATTAANGTRAFTVRQRPTTTYRVRTLAAGTSFASTSPQRVVRRR